MMTTTQLKTYPRTAGAVLRIVALATFRPFDDADWDAFSGCETDSPLVGEAEGFLVVLDGNNVFLQSAADVEAGELGQTYRLKRIF